MNVDNRVSTRIKTSTLAQWGKKDGEYYITLALAGCWNEAVEIIERVKETDPAFVPDESEYIGAFCDSLAASYLIERICIERNRQGIRMKHGSHCKPCCIEKIMVAMHNHVHNVFTYHMNPDYGKEAESNG